MIVNVIVSAVETATVSTENEIADTMTTTTASKGTEIPVIETLVICGILETNVIPSTATGKETIATLEIETCEIHETCIIHDQ